MNDAMRELYQEVIMEHNKSPRNFGRVDPADRMADGHNPLCGDEVHVSLALKEGVVDAIAFEGQGCAISKSSASLMTGAIKGRTEEDAQLLISEFLKLVAEDGGEPDMERLGKLKVFAGIHEFPARVKCAALAWRTLQAALGGQDKPVTTE